MSSQIQRCQSLLQLKDIKKVVSFMIKVIQLIFYSINILFYIYKYKFNEFFSEYFCISISERIPATLLGLRKVFGSNGDFSKLSVDLCPS